MQDSQTPQEQSTEAQGMPAASAPGDTRNHRPFATFLAVLGLCVAATAFGLWMHHRHGGTGSGFSGSLAPRDLALDDPAKLAPSLTEDAGQIVQSLHFTDLTGKDVALADMKGSPILLNFWASWCPPCVKEMPEIDALAAAYAPKGLKVVIASLDATPIDAQSFLIRHRLKSMIPVLDAKGQQFNRLRSSGLPLTLLIRADGTLAERINGYRAWQSPDMKARVEAILAK